MQVICALYVHNVLLRVLSWRPFCLLPLSLDASVSLVWHGCTYVYTCTHVLCAADVRIIVSCSVFTVHWVHLPHSWLLFNFITGEGFWSVDLPHSWLLFNFTTQRLELPDFKFCGPHTSLYILPTAFLLTVRWEQKGAVCCRCQDFKYKGSNPMVT